jgi:type I restriction enzyme, S subunit
MNAERVLAHYERIADAPDAIARLRPFVLDLAVRGKLVQQDPNDEPASELLKRIAQEKARLVKAGEIRKPKTLPAVDEAPFDIPAAWRWNRIREVTSDRGQTVPDTRFTYIDVTAIDKEKGIVAEPKVLAAKEAPSRARKITRKGDVIYSCVRPDLLNVAVIEKDFEPAPLPARPLLFSTVTAWSFHVTFGSFFAVHSWLSASKRRCAGKRIRPSTTLISPFFPFPSHPSPSNTASSPRSMS